MSIMVKRLSALVALGVLLGTILMVSPASAFTDITTDNGRWVGWQGQDTLYQTSVQQPINADGSSNFKANGKAVIPVKFGLSQGTGEFLFQSVHSDNASEPNTGAPCATGHANDCGFLNWEPGPRAGGQPNWGQFTFAQLDELIANYEFTEGTCQGGSLRWTLTLHDGTNNFRDLDIHYQPGAGGVGQQVCQDGTSGTDLTNPASTDPIYVIHNFVPEYTFDSAYNTTYADAVEQLGDLYVAQASLIIDSGWQKDADGAYKDQVVKLNSATIGVTDSDLGPYSETFTPEPASEMTSTCPTDQASVKITKIDGTGTGAVNEPVSIQPNDNDNIFRIVDCKYMYNLATSSLSGAGTYEVQAVIDGKPVSNPAKFDLK